MIRLLAALFALAPLSALAHGDHSDGPTGIRLVFHYIFSFDHYAGAISVVVMFILFVGYRNLRRRFINKKVKDAGKQSDS